MTVDLALVDDLQLLNDPVGLPLLRADVPAGDQERAHVRGSRC